MMLLEVTTEILLQQGVNGVARGSYYALVAVGYTLVYGVLQLINFAHSEVYMLGAHFAYYPSKWLGYLPDDPTKQAAKVPPYWVVVIVLGAMAACAVVGMLIERVAYRPLRNAGRLAPLITAIGVSLLLQYGGQAAFGTEPKPFPVFIDVQPVQLGPVSVSNSKIYIVVVAFVLMVALSLFIHKTRPGRAMRACSYNMQTARLMGINVDKTISLTFALGSAMAAIGGILVAIDQPRIDPLMGMMMGLKAFVAAVLGGIGSISGAVLGGLLLGIVEALVGAYTTTYQDAVAFVVLILVLLFKPEGLLGKTGREKV